MKKFFTSIMLLLPALIMQAQTIYQIQGQADESPYNGQNVTTSGIVTAVFTGGYFIQDGQGAWNGIYVYSSDNVAVGDEIEFSADVDEYFGLTELKNVSGLQILSSGNPLPDPEVLSTWDVNEESWEGVLVKVDEAVCTDPDLGYGEWQLNDGTGPCAVDDLGIAYVPDMGITYAVTGPVYYSYDAYKIEPRSADDIQILETLYFVQQPLQQTPAQNSVTLEWITNAPATTEAFFGVTPDLEMGYISIAGTSTDHQLTIPLPDNSLIYYIRPFSVAGNDTTPDFTRPYATVSNSSGTVNVYFNHKVDHSVAIETPAVWTPDIADTVIRYINMAQQTLDITMYEQESDAIVEAINNAYDRGVTVRYITDDQGNNPALANLNPNIFVLYGNTDAIMHDKFIVIDAADVMNAWVMTGSLNHTHNNLGWDYNNLICLQDKSMAMAFEMEFEEMWGSTGPEPNGENARFGAEKTDNTPHRFLVGGIPMEVYFSPSDHTTAKIQDVIDHAQVNMEFGVMVFTENSLGTAVKNAYDRDVDIRGIIDYVEYSGSEYDYLKSAGINVRDYVNPDGTSWPDGPVFHNKYMIKDFEEGSDQAVLVTGSHNWSASAESSNDENTLIIYDLNLANQYHQDFNQRFNDLLTPVAMPDDTLTPVNEAVTVEFLANDFIPEGVNVNFEIVDQPQHGSVTTGNTDLSYQPDTDFEGHDSLSYRLVNADRPALADTAWIVITVGGSGIAEDLQMYGLSLISTASDGSRLKVNLQSSGTRPVEVSLFDLTGRRLSRENRQLHAGTNSLNLKAPQSAGIYLIPTETNGRRLSGKVMVR